MNSKLNGDTCFSEHAIVVVSSVSPAYGVRSDGIDMAYDTASESSKKKWMRMKIGSPALVAAKHLLGEFKP